MIYLYENLKNKILEIQPLDVYQKSTKDFCIEISNVKDYSKDECIRIILESNLNISFSKVIYQKENNKLYFKPENQEDIDKIKIDKWTKRFTNYNLLKDKIKPNEIIKLLINETLQIYQDQISLQDLFDTYDELFINSDEKNYEQLGEALKKELNEKLEKEITSYYCNSVKIEKNKITIIPESREIKNTIYRPLVLRINDNDILIEDFDNITRIGSEIFLNSSNILKKYIEKIKKVNNYIDDSFNISSSNIPAIITKTKGYFELSMDMLQIKHVVLDEIKFLPQSYKMLDEVTGNEEKILSNILINIDDCPENIRELLYIKQKNKIEELKKTPKFKKIKNFIKRKKGN